MLSLLLVRQVVALMAMLVYAVYGEELREMFGYEHYSYSFYTLASNASTFKFQYSATIISYEILTGNVSFFLQLL